MKTHIIINYRIIITAFIVLCLLFITPGFGQTDQQQNAQSQNDEQPTASPKSSARKPVKNTFESI